MTEKTTTEKMEHIPNNHVVGVIAGDHAAEAAGLDLQQKGFEQPVIFHGEQVAETVDPKGEHSGPVGKIFKAVQERLSEEPNYLAQYQEEARAGKYIIAVPVSDQSQTDTVRGLLENHGAVNIRYFSRLAVADLTPETNPSLRAEESAENVAKAGREHS